MSRRSALHHERLIAQRRIRDLWDSQDAAQEAALERQEVAEARVASRRDETELVDRLVAYLRTLTDPFTADVCGSWLNLRQVARDQRTRRRIISVAINQGKRAGYWRHTQYVQGMAGRPMSLWNPTGKED